jgi:hypothetical protein
MNRMRNIRLWLIALLLAFAGGAHATTLAPPGPAAIAGSSSCGGLQPNGNLEPPCDAVPAIFESAAVGSCPAGSFPDLGKWGCYSCPAGYDKDLLQSSDNPKACVQNTYRPKATTSMAGIFDRPAPIQSKATLKGTACPAGSFFDPIRGGECFTCPAGYQRSIAGIDWADACVVLPSEKVSRITTHARGTGILGTDCPKGSGQFWDGSNGMCHSCPSGFSRTANAVSSSAACSQLVKAKQSKATVAGKAQCKTGEFTDFLKNPKLGGNCYTCPVNSNRTVYEVSSDKACELDPGYKYSVAALVTPLTCPAGQVFDFAGRDTPRVLTRIATQNRSMTPTRAAPTVNGGTCWSCADGYRRSLSAVWENNACDSVGIGWVMPKYTQPGLFGLNGAEAVVREIIKNDSALIRDIALETMNVDRKLTDAQVLQQVWEEIRDTPHQSGPLMVIAYSRMLAAAFSSPTASAADKTLLASFQQMVPVQRTFLANQALQAYTEWDKADFKKNEAYRASLITATVLTLGVAAAPAIGIDLVKNGVSPMPDFAAITLAGSLKDWAADETQGFVVNKVLLSNKMQSVLFRHSAAQSAATRAALTEAGEGFSKALGSYAMQKLGQQSATKVTGRMVLAALKPGPQILVSTAVETMTVWIELQLTRANAGNDLKAKVAEANRPFQVSRLDTDAGRSEVEGEWARMMGSARPPVDLVGISNAASAVINTLPK